MKKEDQLELCKSCENRSTDIPTDIFCNIYGDIPAFDIKCYEYKFSEKMEKNYNSRKVKEKKIVVKKVALPEVEMLFGALWCGGGIIATIADFGFIFYGAIIYGVIKFIKGAMSFNK